MFCPKCSSILLPKNERGKTILACSCGYKNNETKDFKLTESVNTKGNTIEVIDESLEESTLPETDTNCPKCEHKKAFFWTQQTRAADEPPTRFFKCKKCSHTWREYS